MILAFSQMFSGETTVVTTSGPGVYVLAGGDVYPTLPSVVSPVLR